MTDRLSSGFHPFVIPFLAGMAFVLGYCFYGILKILLQLSAKDRRRFFVSLVTPRIAFKNIRDIFCDCLFHVKLWKRNRVLGYMHSSIAFGWFMLILLGHVEVIALMPNRLHLFYYPIFFNFFVIADEVTIGSAILFFLMDFFLLVVLSGIVLAIIKRISSKIFGMRRTARPSLVNRIGMYALWLIFPFRLLAETLTAHITGGSFLTNPGNRLLCSIFGENLNIMPAWWAYSIALFVFMVVLPFSRYMHIPAEIMLIPMRNAGLKIRDARKGFARVQVLSCPNCGVCIDACPMSADKANVKDCTVYLTRQIRRKNEERIAEISDKCLLCGKCQSVCQVCVEGPNLRMAQRAIRHYKLSPDYSNIDVQPMIDTVQNSKVLYFSGCMSQLTPNIGKSVESILTKAGVDFTWMDREGGLCCGRPMFTAGRVTEAEELVRKNEEVILKSGANILLVSCPICYKMFRENYELPGVDVVHYVPFIHQLMKSGKLEVKKDNVTYVYHDPCELGRGCGMYGEPRELLAEVVGLAEADKNRKESICCGGSLGSLSLDFEHRKKITLSALENLYSSQAEAIATACPLCKSTFARYADRPVKDIAEIVNENSEQRAVICEQ